MINTLNEEHRVAYALRSVRDWVDEIVVVDMYSDDRTREIAEEYGARVFMHDRAGYADPARGYALAQATGDWVLILDADEVVSPALARRLRLVANAGEADVVDIPWLNYLLGAPLTGTGWGPSQDHHPRFFKKGWVEATGDVHDFLHVREGARVLRLGAQDGLAVVHFNYTNVAHFVEKLNRYTTIDAAARTGMRPPVSPMRAIAGSGREFLLRFVRQKGYRDGWRGFYLAGLMAFYRFTTYAKVHELAKAGTLEEVERKYEVEAERWLSLDEIEPADVGSAATGPPQTSR